MSRETLTTAVENAITALSVLADELKGTSQPSAGSAHPAPAPTPPLPSKRTAPDTSGITKCPAHGKDFVDGKFGKYCTGKSDDEVPDPNWFNDRGYCRVTPKSAGAWLKQHPRSVAADQQPMGVDEVPF